MTSDYMDATEKKPNNQSEEQKSWQKNGGRNIFNAENKEERAKTQSLLTTD
jgi:hypothetical protein